MLARRYSWTIVARLFRLRHHTFFSLAEANAAIKVQLELLNNRPFRKLPGTRKIRFEEHYDRKANIVTSQLPIKAWHDAMQGPTLAEAILDRRVHNAYKVELKGESMRRKHCLQKIINMTILNFRMSISI